MVSKKLTTRLLAVLAFLGLVWILLQYYQEKTGFEHELELRPSEAPVVVQVYYEALCPDSKNFIVRQLVPTYQKIPHLVDLMYVPYGKATTKTNADGSLAFECQHGPIECEANIVHACTIEHVHEAAKRLHVIACMIKDNMIPKDAFDKCAKELDIEEVDVQKIRECNESPHGAELLKVYGQQTDALRPKISFIPTVTLDGDQRRQASVLKDLKGEVCAVLAGHGPMPDACK